MPLLQSVSYWTAWCSWVSSSWSSSCEPGGLVLQRFWVSLCCRLCSCLQLHACPRKSHLWTTVPQTFPIPSHPQHCLHPIAWLPAVYHSHVPVSMSASQVPQPLSLELLRPACPFKQKPERWAGREKGEKRRKQGHKDHRFDKKAEECYPV